MTTEEEPFDIVPFDLLKQTEQVTHLRRWHTNLWRAGIDTKTSKAVMAEWHTKSHLAGENTSKPHTHTAVAPRGDASAEELSAMDLMKPLNASQRKALKDLVENDFLALKAEINQFADDMAAQRRTEINKEWAAKGADKTTFYAKGQELMAAYRNGADKLVMEARTAGVEFTMPAIGTREMEAKVPGLQTALKAAEAEVDVDRRRALNTLERARLTAQRKVLMTGVTEEALAILDTIPNAHALMVEAAAQRAGTQPSVTA